MENIEIKKHWFFLIRPIFWGIITLPLYGLGLVIIIWALLRYKLDKIEIKENRLYSKVGLLNIERKTIPLNKISMITANTDFISESLGFGAIQIQSSAFGTSINYPYIKNVKKITEQINSHIAN